MAKKEERIAIDEAQHRLAVSDAELAWLRRRGFLSTESEGTVAAGQISALTDDLPGLRDQMAAQESGHGRLLVAWGRYLVPLGFLAVGVADAAGGTPAAIATCVVLALSAGVAEVAWHLRGRA